MSKSIVAGAVLVLIATLSACGSAPAPKAPAAPITVEAGCTAAGFHWSAEEQDCWVS
jgi:hypothetical protein